MTEPIAPPPTTFIAELKRRRVVRAAGVYAVACFVVLQAADLIIPALELPSWLMTALVLLAILGLPVALALAWAFDVTRTPPTPGLWRWPSVARITVLAAVTLVSGLVLFAATSGLFEWRTGRVAAAPESPVAPVTLAVLPFHSTAGEATDLLSIGIPDALSTRLATLQNLRVRPTSAVLQFEQRSVDLSRVARELQVDYVITGTVQPVHDKLRIGVQLVRASDSGVIWGHNYVVARDALLSTHQQAAAAIAGALRIQLDAVDHERWRRYYTSDGVAHERYLAGRSQLARHTREATLKAIDEFESALSRDGDYGLAYAGLAIASARMHLRYATRDDPEPWAQHAVRNARHALELNPTLAEAHEALAAVYRQTEFNWDQTIAESRRALELDPNLEYPNYYMAGAFYHLGLTEQADLVIKNAMQRNPAGDRAEQLRTRGLSALWSGRFAEAATLLEEAQRHSDRPIADWSLAVAYYYNGRTADAHHILRQLTAAKSASAAARARATLAGLLAVGGNRAEATALLNRVTQERYMDHHVAYSIGVAYAQLGRIAEAVHWLRKAAATGFPNYPWYAGIDPLLAPIRHQRPFQLLLDDLKKAWELKRSEYAQIAVPAATAR